MFTQRLAEDAGFRELFVEGQKKLQQQRLELAERVAGRPLPDDVGSVLTGTNIVGSRSMLGVKCLHAHVAQTLSFGSNPIGDDILSRVGRCDTGAGCGRIASTISSRKATA